MSLRLYLLERWRNWQTPAKRAAKSIRKAAPPQPKPKAAPSQRKRAVKAAVARPKAATSRPKAMVAARTSTDAERQRALEILNYATSVGEIAAVAHRLDTQLSVAAAITELDRRAGIRAAVVAANQLHPFIDPALADGYAGQGLTIEETEADLAAKLAAISVIELQGEPSEHDYDGPNDWSENFVRFNEKRFS